MYVQVEVGAFDFILFSYFLAALGLGCCILFVVA